MVFLATAVEFHGKTRQFRSPSFRGGEAVRNICPTCGSLVFGGEVGKDETHTIYAGTLDDPALFRPTVAIFAKDCPAWSPVPPTLTAFPTMPDREAEDRAAEEPVSDVSGAKIAAAQTANWRSFLKAEADGTLGRLIKSASWMSRQRHGERPDDRR